MSIVLHRLLKLGLVCSLGWIIWWRGSLPVQAQTVLFQDSFDDPDISDWTIQRNQQWHNANQPCQNSGVPAEWEVVDGQLGITISGGPSCTTEITPNNLDLSQVTAFTFSFDWNFQESINMDRNVLFLWQDERNWYDVKTIGTQLLIQKVVDGRGYVVPNGLTYYPFAANTSYHFEITVIDHELIVQINDQEVLQTVDEEPYITGFRTIGLQASTGAISRSVSYFDNLVVEELPEPGQLKLAVPPFRQDDPAWATVEYDHALNWSNHPTMARWGCAVTAMAMVLQYHGISTLPTGLPVNPATLNEWLKQEPDGYIGDGLVNWLAVTRLTRLSNQLIGSPKLEFKAVNEDVILSAQQEIDQLKPVIVELPGHFVVGDGIDNTQTDVLITDPYFTFTKLSQHSSPPISLRTFLPSQTDLSYILIATPIDLDVELLNADGQSLDTQVLTEYLSDTIDQINKTQPIKLTLLPKPDTGTYILKLSSPTWQKFDISIYGYDQLAEVKQLKLQLTTGPVAGSWELNFDKQHSDQTAFNTATFDPDWYRQLLSELYQSHDISNRYVYVELDQIISNIQQYPDQQLRYVNLLTQEITVFQPFLSERAQTLLTPE